MDQPRGWRAWITTSSAALRISSALVWATGITASFGAVLIIATFAHISIKGARFALIFGIPLLVVGQLWSIGLVTAQQAERPSGFRTSWATMRDQQRQGARRLMFPDLPLRVCRGLQVAVVIVWICGMSSFIYLANGGPTDPAPGCPWRLFNHGETTCVSQETWERARTAEERLPASVLTFFFAMHFGITLSDTIRRRRATDHD